MGPEMRFFQHIYIYFGCFLATLQLDVIQLMRGRYNLLEAPAHTYFFNLLDWRIELPKDGIYQLHPLILFSPLIKLLTMARSFRWESNTDTTFHDPADLQQAVLHKAHSPYSHYRHQE